jgi:hypothetical protein
MKSNVTKKEIDLLLHYSEAWMLIGHSIKKCDLANLASLQAQCWI